MPANLQIIVRPSWEQFEPDESRQCSACGETIFLTYWKVRVTSVRGSAVRLNLFLDHVFCQSCRDAIGEFGPDGKLNL